MHFLLSRTLFFIRKLFLKKQDLNKIMFANLFFFLLAKHSRGQSIIGVLKSARSHALGLLNLAMHPGICVGGSNAVRGAGERRALESRADGACLFVVFFDGLGEVAAAATALERFQAAENLGLLETGGGVGHELLSGRITARTQRNCKHNNNNNHHNHESENKSAVSGHEVFQGGKGRLEETALTHGFEITIDDISHRLIRHCYLKYNYYEKSMKKNKN